ncbi:MAG: hypothetical protein EPO40_21945 [Myxococcaceae bacterium]|nr:MAG: hypothetical protein EPO40_21945 [Myxococcaceae bacterium]
MANQFQAGINALFDAVQRLEDLRRLARPRTASAAEGGERQQELLTRIDEVAEVIGGVKDALHTGPREKFRQGARLTEEEFYLCRLAGVGFPWAERLGLGAAHDAEAFDHHFYEDDSVSGYINPAKAGDTGRQSMLGLAPEDVRMDALRPTQRDFWERYAPDIFARFRR